MFRIVFSLGRVALTCMAGFVGLFAFGAQETSPQQAVQPGAQDQHHHHEAPSTKPPKIFLDKSPKIIEYQLKRLSNSELLLIERSTDNPKTIPVYAAILGRTGLASGERRTAAAALAELKSTSVVQELLAALGSMTGQDAATARSARDLAAALLVEPKAELIDRAAQLRESLSVASPWARRAAAAALLLADQADSVRDQATKSADNAIDFLVAISWLNDEKARAQFRQDVLLWLADAQPLAVRSAAVRTLATIAAESADSFHRLVKLYDDEPLRDEVVRSLASIPTGARDEQLAAELTGRLVDRAEATPIAARTSDSFVDSVQLVESLLPALPDATSRAYRARLRAVAVRVVRIRTVEEEMRYDVKYFAVEAGRPVEIVLKNEDLMPHNLVVTVPGALKEVAFDAAKMAPDQVTNGKQYVPTGNKVLYATSMVPAGKQERLAFSAPEVPGEYPFVCTFPNHWMRMYGVMVVVSDLDAWQKQPIPPADPIGNNRSFVRKWTLSDLAIELDSGLRGRSPEIGERLFKEAACHQCHKTRGTGGVVGPDLSDVVARWKGDRQAILQEILDPSHKIESKYAVQSVLTSDGKVYSGIIVAEDKEKLSLISSPEQTAPTVIAQADVEEMIKSSKSIMPIGLLDQYTKDEIFEILSYLTAPPAS